MVLFLLRLSKEEQMIFLKKLFSKAKFARQSIIKELLNKPENFVLIATVENDEIHMTIKKRSR